MKVIFTICCFHSVFSFSFSFSLLISRVAGESDEAEAEGIKAADEKEGGTNQGIRMLQKQKVFGSGIINQGTVNRRHHIILQLRR